MQKQASAAARAAKEGRLLEAAAKKAQSAVILLESGTPRAEPAAPDVKVEPAGVKEEADEESGGKTRAGPWQFISFAHSTLNMSLISLNSTQMRSPMLLPVR